MLVGSASNHTTTHVYEGIEAIKEKILKGKFPRFILNQFREMLDYFGQSPIIVRSSSLLEDAYGNSFSGKYESVFCANQGNHKERLFAFLNAVRVVYASTIDIEALTYRKDRGLLDKDEEMALLVQRVSGEKQGPYYFPHIAGVGYSFTLIVGILNWIPMQEFSEWSLVRNSGSGQNLR